MAQQSQYFMIDQTTLDMWLELLGAAACGKLVVASSEYYFTGEECADVKLTAKARTLFEGEKQRLDHRRSKAAAKALRMAERVEKSASMERTREEVVEKSQESTQKVAENSAPASEIPAETPEQLNQDLKPNPLNPPNGGGSVVTMAELNALLAAGLGCQPTRTHAPSRTRGRRRAAT